MERVDFFGSQILFRFKSQKTYDTKAGGLITIGIAVIVMIRLVVLVQGVYDRSSPFVIQKERQVDSPAKFVFDKSNTQFAFGMQDPVQYNQFYDPQIYTIEVLQETQVNGVYTEKVLKSGLCDPSYFGSPETYDGFMNSGYQTMYCIDPEEQMAISGDYGAGEFNYVIIRVSACQTNCKSQTEIDAMLLNGFFSIYFGDITVDPILKDDPYVLFFRDLYWQTTTTQARDITMYWRNDYVESDFGWLSSNIETQKYPVYSYFDVSLDGPKTDYFLQVILRFEKSKENLFHRSYDKITDIISQIGGFAQSFLAIGFILCTYFSEIMLNKSIINEAFNFQSKTTSVEEQQRLLSEEEKSKYQNEDFDLKEQQQQSNFDQSKFHDQPKNPANLISNNQLFTYRIDSKNNLQQSGQPQPQSQQQQQQQQQQSQQHKVKFMEESDKQSPWQPQQQQQLQFQQSQSSQQNQQLISPHQQDPLKSSPQKDFKRQATQNQLFLSEIISKKQKADKGANKSLFDSKKTVDSSQTPKQQKEQAQKDKKQKKEESDQHIKKILGEETNSMQLSFLEYLKFFIWPFGEVKRKKKIIDYSIDKLYYHIDVLNVVKKMMEVDKLKRILMDDDQIKLFEYLPKPTISEEEVFKEENGEKKQHSVQNILYQDTRTEVEKLREAYQSYINIQKREKPTAIDKKILQNIDENLVHIFNITKQDIKQEPNDENNNSHVNNMKSQTKIEMNKSVKSLNQPPPVIQFQLSQDQPKPHLLITPRSEFTINPTSEHKMSDQNNSNEDIDLDIPEDEIQQKNNIDTKPKYFVSDKQQDTFRKQ